MSQFTWFSGRGPALLEAQLDRRIGLAEPAALDHRPLGEQRLVVLDLETSGLDMKRDRLLSIGAVAIDRGAIDFSQQFECTLHRLDHKVGPSVLIHGIAPSAIANGVEPAEALLDFMEFVGDSPLLAFHAGFDQRMLARALKQSLGYSLRHRFFDIAELAPLLCPQAKLPRGGLDDWTRYFGLQVQQRHHASADALATAELALILFSKARRQQLDSLLALQQRLASWQRRQRAHSL
ncbi:3'-5' exonuclease [Pseudomonas borbori]|uniref:DNA polymerase-3 subunit epsilon n=1 Tax=Pseudomonas borbori TaxID=289003 RepID=A0A1I5M6X2_9PSED|nr:3'-5' exonuclease [Pseudomonas borbori]SFP05269.1 DNA polymerase-3 subunit epsilon [Pseudomonas borbori]